MRLHFLCLLLVLAPVKKALMAGDRPNIIFIMIDDHSYQTIGAYGGRLQFLNPTPQLDKLAEQGMRFERCYVENSICAPSRATLLTGKMSHQHGKYSNKQNVVFDHHQQQFQKLLQKAGYQTAMIGKIHLDGDMQGFDYWDVLLRQGEYLDPQFLSPNGVEVAKGYVTDIVVDKALDWLQNGRSEEEPFMLMVHQKAPHRPWIPAKKYLDLYEEIEIPEPDNFWDDYEGKASAAAQQEMTIAQHMRLSSDLKIEPETSPRYQRIGFDGRFSPRHEKYRELSLSEEESTRLYYQLYMKDYLRCIKSVDDNVGRLLDYLDHSGLAENTVVVYTSDQGFYMGEHGWFDKRFMYEESFRTPLIVRWPAVIKPQSVNQELVQNIDFAETFLDLAGLDIPADMQGQSIVPLLRGKQPNDWRDHLYYHYYEYPGPHAVRRHEGVAGKRYKLYDFMEKMS
ncbi:sulfatase [Persicobacter diffluens]